MVWIKGSIRDSVRTPKSDKKQLKKAEGHIGRNGVIMKSVVPKFFVIFVCLYLHFLCNFLSVLLVGWLVGWFVGFMAYQIHFYVNNLFFLKQFSLA